MKQLRMFISLIVFLACILNINAQYWPQYLGPDRNSM